MQKLVCYFFFYFFFQPFNTSNKKDPFSDPLHLIVYSQTILNGHLSIKTSTVQSHYKKPNLTGIELLFVYKVFQQNRSSNIYHMLNGMIANYTAFFFLKKKKTISVYI